MFSAIINVVSEPNRRLVTYWMDVCRGGGKGQLPILVFSVKLVRICLHAFFSGEFFHWHTKYNKTTQPASPHTPPSRMHTNPLTHTYINSRNQPREHRKIRWTQCTAAHKPSGDLTHIFVLLVSSFPFRPIRNVSALIHTVSAVNSLRHNLHTLFFLLLYFIAVNAARHRTIY